jgi:signal transduction histidine kinase
MTRRSRFPVREHTTAGDTSGSPPYDRSRIGPFSSSVRVAVALTFLFAQPLYGQSTATIWYQYRPYVVVAVAIFLAQMLLIAGLLRQRAKRRRFDIALNARSERNCDLASRLISQQEQERMRLARDLDQDIGQRIASLSIGLGAVKRRLDGRPASVIDELSTLQRHTMTLSSDLRQLSQELDPGALAPTGLIPALRARCDDIAAEAGMRVSVHVDDDWRDVPHDVSLCVYRVAEEALRNTALHARARSAVVSLSTHRGRVILRVRDDGCGFEKQTLRANGGLGLASMDQRVRMLGGQFEVESLRVGGTEVVATVPLKAAV